MATKTTLMNKRNVRECHDKTIMFIQAEMVRNQYRGFELVPLGIKLRAYLDLAHLVSP